MIAALYLDARWDLFSAWLEGRNIDPAVCRIWVNQKLGLLRAMQAVNDVIVKADTDDSDLSKEKIPQPDSKHLGTRAIQYSEYGADGSQLLAGLFLLSDPNDYTLWLQEKNFDYGTPMGWPEKQANVFRLLIGPVVKIPACEYVEME